MKKLSLGFIFGVILTLVITSYVNTQADVFEPDIVPTPTPQIIYVTPSPMPTPTPEIIYKERLTDLEAVVENTKDSSAMVYAHMPNGTVMQSSGWVYDKYIITVKHGIEGATKVDIFFDNSPLGVPGTIHYIDEKLDVAVLSFKWNAESVTLGDSDKLIEGEKLISITSPQGSKNMIDECLYSGTVTTTEGTELYISESAIDKGSSGGAIFNYNSEVVGMVINGGKETAGAIPINHIKPILEKLD